MDLNKLKETAKLIRYLILTITTKAQSGHPTSSLSAVELMISLFGSRKFKYDLEHPNYINNDKLIFSKGHASPLFYSLWSVAGAIDQEELNELRHFGSRLEGHPMPRIPQVLAATGSLGQGLSIGVGTALNGKYIDKIPYQTFVLLGDGELAEGSIWEAASLAAHYNLDNLTAIVDVNGLEQVGETMHGWDLDIYEKKFKAFGWNVTQISDGHDINEILDAYEYIDRPKGRPLAILAKTIKGKGISFLENQDSWHGKALHEDQLSKALEELGAIDFSLRIDLPQPEHIAVPEAVHDLVTPQSDFPYKRFENTSPRDAYGNALARLAKSHREIVVLDAGVSNSTRAEKVKEIDAESFFEMFIAEQNMIGAAIGLAKTENRPFVSTFAAFFTRAFDQIRMAQYSNVNITFAGTHAGVSIGKDGASQMGMEDIAMFRSILNSVVLYPSDAVSTERCVELAMEHNGITYIRLTRESLPIVYSEGDEFHIGGSKTIEKTNQDEITIVTAGITLFEAHKAYEELQKENIKVRLIDLYSIKPLDEAALKEAAVETKAILTIEDHYPAGGLGEAVKSVLSTVATPVYSIAVNKIPQSGESKRVMEFEGLDFNSIIQRVKEILSELG